MLDTTSNDGGTARQSITDPNTNFTVNALQAFVVRGGSSGTISVGGAEITLVINDQDTLTFPMCTASECSFCSSNDTTCSVFTTQGMAVSGAGNFVAGASNDVRLDDRSGSVTVYTQLVIAVYLCPAANS